MLFDLESVIKNIIREIVQECGTKGQAVSETLVAFMVKAVVLDPANRFNVDRALTKEDVQELIHICVKRLLNTQSPSLDTIKMQVYFDMNYTTRGEFLEEHHRVLESRLQPVVREITDSRARTRDDLDCLYRKIVSAILLRSGLGSATDISVVREATAALQSVFPQSELGTFMSLAKRDKERQLQELTYIVTGIRLFNKECGKGGEGIDDLPAILNEAIPATTHNINMEIEQCLHIVSRYISLVEKLEQEEANSEAPSDELLREAVINCRQNETFLRIILHDVISCAQQVESLESQLATRMQQLQTTIQSKTAVPTAQVYPQFMHLAQIWTSFQDEMVLLSVLSNILVSLEPFSQGHKEMFKIETLDPLLEGVVIKTDQDRINETSGVENRVSVGKDDYRGIEWLYPDTTKNFSRLPLQYRGYCGWTLATHDRLLIPGNADIGILHFKNHYYTFVSKEAALEFASDPDRYILQISECAKKSPELIQLLELHTQFASLASYGQGKEATKLIEKPITKSDSGTQTDTHFYESNIVKSYEWNEWELRRKAIKLANLRTKITQSVQTNLSNLRRDNIAQCYPPKEFGTQTLADNHTNVPKPQVFLGGLRGGGMSKPTVFTKVDLTLDVEEN